VGPSQHHAEGGRVPLEIHPAFLQQKNVIVEVDDKLINMFFTKGLKDSAPIRKLAMKNLKTSERLLTVIEPPQNEGFVDQDQLE
jgi:hypothetical protein